MGAPASRPPRARSLRARALACLARREHSRTELARKLAPHAVDADELNRLLDSLEADKLLSDARFAEVLARSLFRVSAPGLRTALVAAVALALVGAGFSPLYDTPLSSSRARSSSDSLTKANSANSRYRKPPWISREE